MNIVYITLTMVEDGKELLRKAEHHFAGVNA